jgi:hypothetical protein
LYEVPRVVGAKPDQPAPATPTRSAMALMYIGGDRTPHLPGEWARVSWAA